MKLLLIASAFFAINAWSAPQDEAPEVTERTVPYSEFSKTIVDDVYPILEGDGCTTEVKEIRDRVEVTIRKNGRLKTVTFSSRDRIDEKLTMFDAESYLKRYSTGERWFIEFEHNSDNWDKVTIDTGGRKTVCEVYY